MDLETLKTEMELEPENLSREDAALCKELESIQASLKRMKAQNSALTSDINERNESVRR